MATYRRCTARQSFRPSVCVIPNGNLSQVYLLASPSASPSTRQFVFVVEDRRQFGVLQNNSCSFDPSHPTT